MGGILDRAFAQAGLGDLVERALHGKGLGDADLSRMRGADVLLLAGLADAVRQRFHGDEVRVLSSEAACRDPELLRVALDGGGSGGGQDGVEDGKTGQELLAQVALARLATPGKKSVGIGVEQIGLQLAQVALAFGANVLLCELQSQRTLPLLDGPVARRAEIGGLIARTGRTARFEETQQPLALGSQS
jgi:2-iminoacetate synthase ThiH